MGAIDITRVKSLIDEASACFSKDLPRLFDEVGELLPVYAGIPSRLDIFRILNIATDEDRHTECLRWLLDPEESHGLGDALLRRFLLRTDHDGAIAHALRPDRITAEVRTQVEMPDYGIPDLVVVLHDDPRCIVVVEAKINAPLTNKDGVPQTRRYRKAAIDGALQKSCAKGSLGSSAVTGLDPSAVSFIFLPMHLGQSPDDALEVDDDSVRRFVTVLQRTVAADCLEVLRDADPDPAVATLVRAFCTSVLRASNDGAAYEAMLGLRRLIAESAATRGRRRTSDLAFTRLVTAHLQELRGEMETDISNEQIREIISRNFEIVSLLVEQFKSARKETLDGIAADGSSSAEAKTLDETLKDRSVQREDYVEQGGDGRRLGVNGLGGVSFFLDPGASGGLTVRVQLRLSAKVLVKRTVRRQALETIGLEGFPLDPLLENQPSLIQEPVASLDDARKRATILVVAGLRVLTRLAEQVFPKTAVEVAQKAPAPAGVSGAPLAGGG